MLTKHHPSHGKTTYLIAAVLGAIAIAAWISAMVVGHDGLNEAAVNTCILVAMTSAFTAMIVFAARTYVARCPECHSVITSKAISKDDEDRRLFVCEKCQIAWTRE